MGLFGPKISKEEKAFQTAYKKALHKPTTGAVNELKAALRSSPTSWQGYWLCAICHDIGVDGASPDEEKAEEYFLQAEKAVQGTESEKWFNSFMLWYRRDAGSLYKPLNSMQKKLRRFGVALCHSYLIENGALTKVFEQYPSDGYQLGFFMEYISHSDWERVPFDDFLHIATFDHNEQVKGTRNFYNEVTETLDDFITCVKDSNACKDPQWWRTKDMYYYLLGLNCIEGGDLLTGELADALGKSETTLGIESYIHAAEIGCQPAVHELVRLANASQNNFDLIQRVYINADRFSTDPFELFLLDLLKRCVEKEDEEAMRLFQVHYAERFS